MVEAGLFLKKTRDLLIAIAGRITQDSDRRARAAVGAATNAVVGTATASSVMGAVGALGTASTGTAIAGLAGAAKTTASLFWIGGFVGGGVAAGTIVLSVGALGAGIYGSARAKKAILGSSRRDKLSEIEQKVVFAIHSLAQSIDVARKSDHPISTKELALFSQLGVSPIMAAVHDLLDQGALSELSAYHRARLRGHLINLYKLQETLETE